MTALATQSVVRRRRANLLPYLLSLPALIVCIGILVPFLTAVYYSMLRFRLNLPAMKGFIWFNNYINFLTDPEFWNTVRVSHRVHRLLPSASNSSFGLAIALLLQKRTRLNNAISILLLLPADDRAGARRLDVEIDDEPEFRRPVLSRAIAWS